MVVTPATGESAVVRLLVMRNDIVRVSTSREKVINLPESIMVVARPESVAFELKQQDADLVLTTSEIKVVVSLENGTVVFFKPDSEPVLAAVNSGEFEHGKVAGKRKAYSVRQAFLLGQDEALYGLGQHQNGQVNLAGENVYLTTHNLIITIPYLISSKNYGILWDNNSDSRFGRPLPASPLFQNLELYDAEGNQGGLTVRYFDGDKLLLTRTENDPNYQFLENNNIRQFPLPEETRDAQNLRIEIQGSISSDRAGTHEILMYSSGYASLSVDGEVLLDRWRVNWNPWYHPVKLKMETGVKKSLKVDWIPQGGYFRLLQHEPGPESEGELISFASETGESIDYYFVAGDNADELISGYRWLTGKSVMLPRWAYGFWQSRERYKTADELVAVVEAYRARNIPIDNIVLDWSYWPVDAWGSHDFDPEFFPDPKGMVDRVHALNARIMISVWPKFYPSTDNYKELDAQGFLLKRNIEEGNKDWISPGYLNAFYDAFNPEARAMYWRQLDEKINVFGFDAWWLDAVEPDMHSNLSWEKRKELMSPNHLGSGAEVFNAYAVPHAESVYKGDRASAPDTRVFILTRSGFGGIQRTASAIWSGDTVSRWSNLREQIAAGIGTALAGMPNWTFDIGGFTPEDRYRYSASGAVGSYSEMNPEELPEWQELNTRWYQFGAFVPLYRSHGQNPWREIYNIAPEGSVYYNSMVAYTRLRYRLMPYIYSLAGDMYHKDGTLMRGLAMDFPADVTAGNLNDQYMFGPAFLVSPVYEKGVTVRKVYLPEHTHWYDFYSGKAFDGGQEINTEAPVERLPLFVRAGSIIPTGPEVQNSGQLLNADITLTTYIGANGEFELYEDDGLSYAYENGEWSRIPFRYDESEGVLTIGSRIGNFKGMAARRTFHIRWICGETKTAASFDEGVARTIDYEGKEIRLDRNCPGKS